MIRMGQMISNRKEFDQTVDVSRRRLSRLNHRRPRRHRHHQSLGSSMWRTSTSPQSEHGRGRIRMGRGSERADGCGGGRAARRARRYMGEVSGRVEGQEGSVRGSFLQVTDQPAARGRTRLAHAARDRGPGSAGRARGRWWRVARRDVGALL